MDSNLAGSDVTSPLTMDSNLAGSDVTSPLTMDSNLAGSDVTSPLTMDSKHIPGKELYKHVASIPILVTLILLTSV